MGNIQIFQLIERKKLHGEILRHIETLMSIDKNVRLVTIVSHTSKFRDASITLIRYITASSNFGLCDATSET